jgi:hypothetical protein
MGVHVHASGTAKRRAYYRVHGENTGRNMRGMPDFRDERTAAVLRVTDPSVSP